MKYGEIKELKRKLRSNQTPAEQILWRHIRNRKLLGRKFLRQYAIIYESIGDEHFFFIPDFYCPAEKLVIELDGKVHDFRKAKDQRRDRIINEQGISVLRIKNEELKDLQAVLQKIKNNFSGDDKNQAYRRKKFREE